MVSRLKSVDREQKIGCHFFVDGRSWAKLLKRNQKRTPSNFSMIWSSFKNLEVNLSYLLAYRIRLVVVNICMEIIKYLATDATSTSFEDPLSEELGHFAYSAFCRHNSLLHHLPPFPPSRPTNLVNYSNVT